MFCPSAAHRLNTRELLRRNLRCRRAEIEGGCDLPHAGYQVTGQDDLRRQRKVS
jgi:hypothetical protein